MESLLLRVVALEWQGKALVMWTGLFFDLAKSLFGMALALSAVAYLSVAGRRRMRFLDIAGTKRVSPKLKAPALAAAAAVLCILKVAQYLSLQGTTDAAAYFSIVWNALKGGILVSPVYGYASQLEFRFNPILVLYAPVASMLATPLALMMAHSLIIASSVVILWRLTATLELPETPRWLLCLLFVSNPFFHDCLATWFFPETLPLPLFLAALLCWERKRLGAFALFAALLLGTKEEAGVALFAFGLAVSFLPRRRREGFLIMAASAAAFFSIAALRSGFSHQRSDAEWAYFGWGENAGATIKFAFQHPLAVLKQWAWPPSRFWPFCALVFSAGGLVAFFPPALLGLLALNAPHQAVVNPAVGFHRLDSNYSSYLLPLLFWGAAYGLSRLWKRPTLRPTAVSLLLVAAGAGLWRSSDYVGFFRVSGKQLNVGWSYISMIRPEDSLWTPQAFAPALAFRRRMKIFDSGTDPATLSREYFPNAVLLIKNHWDPAGLAGLTRFLGAHRYTLVRDDGGLALWRAPVRIGL